MVSNSSPIPEATWPPSHEKRKRLIAAAKIVAVAVLLSLSFVYLLFVAAANGLDHDMDRISQARGTVEAR